MAMLKIEKVYIEPKETDRQVDLIFSGDNLDLRIDFRNESHGKNVYITDIYTKSKVKSKKLIEQLTSHGLEFSEELDPKQISCISTKDLSVEIVSALYQIDPTAKSHMEYSIHQDTIFNHRTRYLITKNPRSHTAIHRYR